MVKKMSEVEKCPVKDLGYSRRLFAYEANLSQCLLLERD